LTVAGRDELRPSAGWGLRQALRLWRLVLACWIVSVAAVLPAVWVVGGAAGPALEHLPDSVDRLPDGEVFLILASALPQMAAPLGLAVVSALITLWSWTVLWHAGVVNWALWAGGRRVRLGEVLGLGMVSWWRYVRLSATAAAVLVVLSMACWLPLMEAAMAARRSMAETRMLLLLAMGLVVVKLLALVVWAATLRGAWLLGLPERRSVVAAWLRALVDTLRMPVRSLGTVLLWAMPAVLLSLLPLAIGGGLDVTHRDWAVPAMSQLAAAGRAFCWVALYLSFAPVTGLIGVVTDGEE
jgi:hypothetical protein